MDARHAPPYGALGASYRVPPPRPPLPRRAVGICPAVPSDVPVPPDPRARPSRRCPTARPLATLSPTVGCIGPSAAWSHLPPGPLGPPSCDQLGVRPHPRRPIGFPGPVSPVSASPRCRRRGKPLIFLTYVSLITNPPTDHALQMIPRCVVFRF